MTTYTKRDLRAVDLLALVLFVIGIVLALFAVFKVRQNTLLLWIAAVSTLSLGVALNLKLRQLVKNKGEEPQDYDGVPE